MPSTYLSVPKPSIAKTLNRPIDILNTIPLAQNHFARYWTAVDATAKERLNSILTVVIWSRGAGWEHKAQARASEGI
jgi:hypothetical protein